MSWTTDISIDQLLIQDRKIAWSRLGCIAYISQDGLQVIVRHLACNPSDGKWALTEEYPQNQIAQLHLGQQLLHLCWNETGSDLAVLDASGRISILSIPAALNSLGISRQTVVDPPDDGAQIVGMMWMNSNRAVRAYSLPQNYLLDLELIQRTGACIPPSCKIEWKMELFTLPT